MEPRLVVMAGPLKGAMFALSGKEVWIGRDPGNHICLSDPLVSRRHCVIAKNNEQFLLRDLDSSNGIFVNDGPVHECPLAEGDLVKVGDTLFVFLLSATEPAQSSTQSLFDDGIVVKSTTFIVEPDQARYLQSEKVDAALPASDRIARDLNALLRISARISQIRRVDELRKQLLEFLLELIPAERGAILLDKDLFNVAEHLFRIDRTGNESSQFKLSRTVVDWVRHEGKAISSNDIKENVALREARSLLVSHIRSLLAVPIMLDKQVLGVIYMDSTDPKAEFDEDHLQLASAIAGLAAAPFDNARQLELLAGEADRLRAEINLNHKMIGESAQMKSVYQVISKVAASDSTVLILGESGTGKELAARAIHHSSARADKPFIVINCAGLSETLIESDLFGHEKGAFTGAYSQKKGKLEIADSGTVFLDELGELPLPLQAKLLRALQTREFERVGGTRPIKVDIRLVAATNRDLEAAIKDGGFRSDLYYRLSVVSLTMPALRNRRDDIPLLAQYFALKYSGKCKRQIKGLTPNAMKLLVCYHWPGNVRELENAIERAIVMGSTEMIQQEDLPESLSEHASVPIAQQTNFHSAVREAKKQIILNALDQTEGSYIEAAKILGMLPNNLHRLASDLGLKSSN